MLGVVTTPILAATNTQHTSSGRITVMFLRCMLTLVRAGQASQIFLVWAILCPPSFSSNSLQLSMEMRSVSAVVELLGPQDLKSTL
jgi:hypothetical protein